jgi:hypothetical protein
MSCHSNYASGFLRMWRDFVFKTPDCWLPLLLGVSLLFGEECWTSRGCWASWVHRGFMGRLHGDTAGMASWGHSWDGFLGTRLHGDTARCGGGFMGTQLDAGGRLTMTPSLLISPIARRPPNQKGAVSQGVTRESSQGVRMGLCPRGVLPGRTPRKS